MMKQKNLLLLRAFAKYALEREFDVGSILSLLRVFGVLDGDDFDRVDKSVRRSDRCRLLFLDILPKKDDSAIDQLFLILTDSGKDGHAEYLHELIENGVPEEEISTLPALSDASRIQIALKQNWNKGAGKKNKLFTGRNDIITEVADLFKTKDTAETIAAVCLSGTGGIGKTSIALEFCYRKEKDFSFLAWIKADSIGRFFEEMESLGEALGLPPRPNKKDSAASLETIEAVKVLLARNQGWLVVLDDVSEVVLDILAESLPNSGGSVLITSRIQITTDWVSRIKVGELPESTELLGAVIGARKPADFEELKGTLANDKLGRLPLAIMHAGSYLKQRPNCSIAEYLRRFEESVEILNKKLPGVKFDGPQQVLTTWNLTMDHLRKQSEDTFLFLNICSFLSTSIEDSIICRAAGFREETLRKTEERVEDAKVLLASFSMLDLMDDGVRIHVLVQEAVIFYSSIEEKTVGLSDGAAILVDNYNSLEKETNPQPLRRCFVHSEAMIHKFHRLFADHIAQVVSSDLKNSYHTLSFPFLSTVGKLSVKVPESFLETILEIVEYCFGASSRETAGVIGNVALVLGKQGNHIKKKSLLERELQIKEMLYGKDDIEVASTLNNLGSCYGDLGDHQRKKEMLERALKIRETFYGENENHVEVAITLNNLGSCYGALGDHQRRKEMLERALKINKTFYGETHVEVARTLNNLGNCYGDLGDHQKEKEMLERALKIRETFYGENHVEVAMTLNNLGICYRSLKMYPGSIALLKRAIKILECGSPVLYLCRAYRAISESLIFEESHDIVNLLDAKEYLEKELALLSDNLHDPVLQSRFNYNVELQEAVDRLISVLKE